MLFLPGISGGGTLILTQSVVFCRYSVLKREKTQEDRDMKKRIVSLLMAVLMLVTMLPVTAMAEELTTTDPTEEQVVSGETTPDPAEEPETPEEPEQPDQPGEPEEPTQPTVPQEPEQPSEPEWELPEFPEVLSQEAYITPVKDANASDPCDSFEWKEIGDGQMPFMYNDGMLFDDARSLSTDIAKASIILADTAYDGKGAISTMLKSMGYKCLDNSFSYGRTVDIYSNDVVAYTIAYKDVTYQGQQYRLYCVPVRGTMKNSEWYSNFNIGTTGDHEGFHKAASEVYAQLATELMDDGIDAEHSLVWLTGHSRGAAVANIVAGMLNKNTVQCTPQHIFAYTFACPAVSKKADTAYTNIYNFNNPGDPITIMPLEEWGYKRNGQDIELSLDHLDNLQRRFKSYVGEEYQGATTTDDYVTMLSGVVPSEESIKSPLIRLLLLLAAYGLGGKNETTFEEIVAYSGYTVGEGVRDILASKVKGLLELKDRLLRMKGNADEILTFVNTYEDEVRNMTDEEFEQFRYEHREEFIKMTDLFEEELGDIGSIAKFLSVSPLLMEYLIGSGEFENIVVAVTNFLLNADGNLKAPLWHGHQQETYILWINSMYGGCSGWYGNEWVNTVEIPNTRTISRSAFAGCSRLTNIRIPNTVKLIGESAFSNCYGLKEVTLPISAEYVALSNSFTESFIDCTGVQKITYTAGDGSVFNHGNANTLPRYAYRSLTTVVYEEGITEIPEYALYRSRQNADDICCSNVTSITLPSTLKKIGTVAFRGCLRLKEIAIPESLESIGNSAFSGCSSMASATSLKNVKSIGGGAFYGCSSLKEVDISSLTEISDAVFSNCSSLASIVIPNVVKTIGASAFSKCYGLREVTLPISAEYVALSNNFTESFLDCTGVQKITYTVGDGSVFNHGNANTLPRYAYRSLTTVVYEEGITEIPEYALYRSRQNADDICCTSITSITLPGTVTKIGAVAFRGCSGLKDIVIPGSVESIGISAFSGCSSLKEANISNLTEINNSVFFGCSSLASIVIPNAVKKIGESAFSNCYGLKEVTLPISAEYATLGGESFLNCIGVQKITYTVGDGSVFAHGNANTLPRYAYRSLTTVIYEDGITEIPEYALYRSRQNADDICCTNITSITLPSTVKKIGTCAFNGCSGLADVYYLDREFQWENVKANTATGNTPLLNARIHFVQDGDINGSFGAPDVNDVQCLYTYLTSGSIQGAYKNNAEMFTSLADVNMDSTVDVYDLQLLYETVSGIV